MAVIPQFALESEAIFEQCTYGICVANTQGVMTRVNEAFKEITGMGAQYFIGVHVRDAVTKGIINNSSILRLMEGHNPSTAIVTTMAGKQLFSRAFPVFDRNRKIIHLATVMRSVTGRNSIRELERVLPDNRDYYSSETRFLGRSPEMVSLFNLIKRLSFFDCPLLIQGETGVGKGLLARKIHENSARCKGPLITINCGAIPGHLLESELFGYVHGAFTGSAKGGKTGLFEAAQGGSILLDEIGDLPLRLQVKLLRFLEDRTIIKLGAVEEKRVDVRILAATNRDLARAVETGNFRPDLYYRLNVVPVVISPLRERPEDIQELLDEYLDMFNRRYRTDKILAGDAVDALLNYCWPGNVRELINLLERLVITTPRNIIEFEDLPNHIIVAKSLSRNHKEVGPIDDPQSGVRPLREEIESYEKRLLKNALLRFDRQEDAAAALEISMSTLTRKIHRHRLKNLRN